MIERVTIRNLHCSTEILLVIERIRKKDYNEVVQKACYDPKSIIPIVVSQIPGITLNFDSFPIIDYELGPDGVVCKDGNNISDAEYRKAVDTHGRKYNLGAEVNITSHGQKYFDCYHCLHMQQIMCGDKIDYEAFWSKEGI